jgi:CheY-like chemotaxis protein
MLESRAILIVEDNPMSMELVADLLEAAGYGVLKAVSGEEALREAAARKPDLILMDISMPGMDGLEATRRLKRDPLTAGIPVVALTASIMYVDQERAKAAGCQGMIAKPIDTRQFVKVVAGYLAAAAGEKQP